MTLTRTVSMLTSVYTTVEAPFFARTSDLSAEWELKVSTILSENGGNVEDALLALGLNLTDEQKEKYCQQGLKKSFAGWLKESAAGKRGQGSVEVNDGEGEEEEDAEPEPAGDGEEGEEKTPEKKKLLGYGNTDPDEFFTFFSHAFAHPVQYGEDLRLAAARGENDVVAAFIRRGCDPNAGDGLGWTAIHHAAQYGWVKTIDVIVETHGREKMDLDAQDKKGWTAFMNAIANSEKGCAQKLIQLGADTNVASWYGRNAMHIAAMKGLEDMVRFLTSANGKLMEGHDKAGWTPLFCAVQHDELKIVKILVASGCNIDAEDHLGKTAIAYGDDLAEATINGTAPASPRSPRK